MVFMGLHDGLLIVLKGNEKFKGKKSLSVWLGDDDN